ncbi:MAG: hypothetical protein ACD_2C00141G0014 [uncultured bacterium (gcode 4)]|uniref:Uncharacterized protein n=1 Tax=uncultured bacterium (gcode 4) TaxID=1234023 RepID=K2G5P8_9BACT|nr:MAG: hypothetical protein ACD_2C00141G0014 [uncultured bacterium (gcode 4)]
MINQPPLLSKVGKTIRGTGYSGHASDAEMRSVILGHTIPPKTPSFTPAGSENDEALPLRTGPWIMKPSPLHVCPRAYSLASPFTLSRLARGDLLNDFTFAIIIPSGPE